jgi:hypothetical protein
MWFWLNIPLAALFLTATAGIPIWMVIKHPDTAPDFSAAPQPAEAGTRTRAAQVAAEQDDTAAWSQRAAQEPGEAEAPASAR